MSLFGALKTGVSGLTAQSSSMTIISDNIANVNTVGYKANSASFSTLVTKQTSSTNYSSGGVFCRVREGIDAQGLLSSTSNATDIAISGDGFFVTTAVSVPDGDDMYSYTRAGSFGIDKEGYLVNENGQYLQAWTLMSYDGTSTANTITVNNNTYMKAYTDTRGKTVYINDNIIDAENLQAVNLNRIGGTAQETTEIQFGANLPADDPIFDPGNPEAGGRYTSAVLMYDSLGNSHNVEMIFTKTGTGAWDVDMGLPTGVSSLVSYSNAESTNDASPDVYAAAAQLEFNKIPSNHSTIGIEIEGINYVFEFSSDGTKSYNPLPNEQVIMVDTSAGIVTVEDAVKALYTEMQGILPGAGRFSMGSNGMSIQVRQSTAGSSVRFNCSGCYACLQSQTNPDPQTGIATGYFEMPEIDWDVKNTARIEFTSTKSSDYLNKTITLGQNIYKFTNKDEVSDGIICVNIDSAVDRVTNTVDVVKMVGLLKAKINDIELDPERFIASGSTLEIEPNPTGENILLNTSAGSALVFTCNILASYANQVVNINGKQYKFIKDDSHATGDVDGDTVFVSLAGLAGQDRTDALPIAVVNELKNAIDAYYAKNNDFDTANYFAIKGNKITAASDDMSMSVESIPSYKKTLTFSETNAKNYDNKTIDIDGITYRFSLWDQTGTEADGTVTVGLLDKGAISTEKLDFVSSDGVFHFDKNLVGKNLTIGNKIYGFKKYGAISGNEIALVQDQQIKLDSVAAGDTLVIKGTTYTFKNNADASVKTDVYKSDATHCCIANGRTFEIPDKTGTGTITYTFYDPANYEAHKTEDNVFKVDYTGLDLGTENGVQAALARTSNYLKSLMSALPDSLGKSSVSETASTVSLSFSPYCYVDLDTSNLGETFSRNINKLDSNTPASYSDGTTVNLSGTTLGKITGTGSFSNGAVGTEGNTEDGSIKNVTEYMTNSLKTLATLTGGSYSAGVITYNDSNCLKLEKAASIGDDVCAISLTTTSNAAMNALGDAAGKLAYVTSNTMNITYVRGEDDPIPAEKALIGDVNQTTDGNITPVNVTANQQGLQSAVTVTGKNNGNQSGQPVTFGAGEKSTAGKLVLTNKFSFNNIKASQVGNKIAGVSFNADGTPSAVNINNLAFEWCNGAADMTGNYYESTQVNLFLGNENTATGLTQLSGAFTTNFISQNGAKFGSYTGVSISEDGVVTAIFDNGQTRPIAQIPVATFVNANSMEALTGNIWIETTGSGNATLRTAGEGGSGTITASSLEDSTVDIANEFTNMITTQRAYSAASKIITTSDDMLEELINIKR
ncbi:MAG: flagellar hook-basal body complex protein [Alphaproteobacteria bacterium]|nr:flagellar hook-basal body complex protein [Alphaproteobacteria bacterium]